MNGLYTEIPIQFRARTPASAAYKPIEGISVRSHLSNFLDTFLAAISTKWAWKRD